MKLTINKCLKECRNTTNCVLAKFQVDNIDNIFLKLISEASSLPRTITLTKESYYWHGVCKSLIFRFPDDLEILKRKVSQNSTKGIIEIKSSSRFGLYDLGVNQRRVNGLYNKLINK